jgi:RNA polymerase sigma-70 factor (ECF subfamily)
MTAPHSAEILGYRECLLGHIRCIVRDPAEAEDVLQETFLKAHGTIEQLRDEGALLAWLFRIATHISLDHLRQRSRRPKIDADSLEELPDSDDVTPSLQSIIEQREMSACVQRYLLELPADHRAVMLMHDFEGMTALEIAEALELSLPNAKMRLHRARERLRQALLGGCTFSCDCRGVVVCEPKRDCQEELERETNT